MDFGIRSSGTNERNLTPQSTTRIPHFDLKSERVLANMLISKQVLAGSAYNNRAISQDLSIPFWQTVCQLKEKIKVHVLFLQPSFPELFWHGIEVFGFGGL